MNDKKAQPFAGDISPEEAWTLLQAQPAARLVDVRTAPEWTFVGLPDLEQLGREPICVEWQKFPSMEINQSFVDDVQKALRSSREPEDTPLLFICRSGGRSRAAATKMAQAGFRRAYNVAGGFEGDLDSERHRGSQSGWKARGLPWKQS